MKKEENNNFEKKVEEYVKKFIPDYLKTTAFIARKLTDTPTDGLAVVNRNYVNINGSIASAPIGSIIGQQYFATDLGYPVFKSSTSRWVNSVGSVIG